MTTRTALLPLLILSLSFPLFSCFCGLPGGPDLSPLRGVKDYHVGGNPFGVDFNLCGPVVDPNLCPKGYGNSSMCGVTYDGGFVSFGLASSVTYTLLGADLRIFFSGDKYSSEIRLGCAANNSFAYDYDAAHRHAIVYWTNPLMCYGCGTPGTPLGELRKSNEDYFVKNDHAWQLTMNLCGPLVSGQFCPSPQQDPTASFAGSCQYASDGRSWTLGSFWQSKFQETPNGVIGYYTGGTDNGRGPRSYQVNFTCNRETNNVGSPQFVGENPTRHFNFAWSSSVACGAYNCLFQSLNLSSLRNHSGDFLSVIPGLGSATINFCGPLLYPSRFCPPSASLPIACVYSSTAQISLGSARKARYISYVKAVRVIFEGGTNGNSLDLTLSCPSDGIERPPQFQRQQGTSWIFNWPTNLVCNFTGSSTLNKINLN